MECIEDVLDIISYQNVVRNYNHIDKVMLSLPIISYQNAVRNYN